MQAAIPLRIGLAALACLLGSGVTCDGQPTLVRSTVRTSGDVRTPRLLKQVQPDYPREAVTQMLEGVVTLEITIGPSGLVEKAGVLQSVPGLDQAAIAAVRQWEFETTMVRGEPVPVVATVSLSFAILRRRLNPPSESETARAADLFREARDAINRLGPSRTSYGMDNTQSTAASLFLELAKAEAPAFSNLAADDATQAFRIAQSIAGARSDVEERQSNDSDVVGSVLRWRNKTRIETDAITVLISVGANDRARELARTADVARAGLYAGLVLVEPADRLLALAEECRASDGTFPYSAVAARARTIRRPFAETLVRAGIAALEDEASFAGRSEGIEFILNTYELVPQEVATRALLRLADRLLARPSIIPGRGGLDRDTLGSKIVSLMQMIDPGQAAALAKEHPEWRLATSPLPPKSPPGRPDTGRPMSLQKYPPMMTLPRMSPQEFERTLADSRRPPLTSQELQRLIALGYLLLTAPPR